MNDAAPKFVSNADRRFVLAAAIAMCVVAWAYVVYLGRGMARMSGPALAMLPRMSAWQPIDLVLAFVMWAIMMVAMMLPSALPMLLLFASLGRRTRPPRPRVDSMAFLAAYIAVWSLFSAAATLIQWRLTEARLVSPMMDGASDILAGALLLAAGAYQATPLKRACLAKCRSPTEFLVAQWRAGLRCAWTMGLRHVVYCLGCCWLIMMLLFALGVMNLLWIAALAAFVLVEKTFRRSGLVSVAGGLIFAAWGIALLARAAMT